MDGKELLQRYADGERDFSGVDLREASIRGKRGSDPILKDAIFKGGDLSQAQGYHIDFSGTDFSNACLEGTNIKYANLRRANLSGANLKSNNLAETDLSCADLSGANISNSNLTDANLLGANLSGIIQEGTLFCNTTMSDESIYNDPTRVIEASELLRRYAAGETIFENLLALNRIDLSNAKLPGISLEEAILSNANLSGINLEEANLARVNF